MVTEFAHRIAVDWHKTLEQVLASASQQGRRGVLVFDLDSTVFDNRPRQARIVREYGAQKGIAALTRCQAFHFTNGWDLTHACVNAGLSADEAEALFRDLKGFWAARFFTSPYCRDDIEIVGAPRYLHACLKTGARLVYVTGRHEEMRGGSIEAMARCGMPVPTGDDVLLMMKPTLRETDDAYKRVAHQALDGLGFVLAAFDNEPTHVNDYAERFPTCVPVHLATDHSGRPVTLAERVVSIPHFAW
ncbi:MAG: hypothetical protein INH41_07175 [Myxococcaceae bacterium]|jgi:hypothetical protein|nr:hypothetical protein [Myxococcaceae bacterium]MCA3012167.1 hypothetical protein [Myxococcaceae bacterium]